MEFMKQSKSSLRNRFLYVMMGILVALPMGITHAQTNPYRYGSPHYWMAQSTLHITDGKFDIAYEDLQKARKGYKDIGDISFQVNAIGTMALLKSNMGEWSLAQQHFQEALEIAKEAKDEMSISKILVEIITFSKGISDMNGYNHFVAELDSLCRKSSSAIVKTCYHTYWSNEYVLRQEYSMAENHLRQCWDAMQDLPFMEREQAKLSYYNNMVSLYKQRKNYGEAIDYARKYVEQSKVINGRNSNLHLQSYSVLANIYAENGDSVNAFAVLDSMACGVGLPNQDEVLLASFYNRKGVCHTKFKDYESALACFEKASEILKERLIEDTPSKYECYLHRAEVLYMQKKYDEAYDSYMNCMQACRNKYGESSGNYYQALFTLASINAERGNVAEADSLFNVSMNFLLSNMKTLWKYSTPSQREQFWKEALNMLSGMAAFSLKCGIDNSRLTETCYNALLFSKALLLETEKTIIEIITNEGTKEDIDNYRQLMSINTRLLALRCNYEYNKDEIDTLVVVQRNLEQQLTVKCQLYNDYNSFLDIDCQKVRKSLKKNEVLIDFSDFMSEDSVHQYVAYIIRGEQEYPLLVKCFNQNQLDSLLNGDAKYNLYNYEFHKDCATKLLWGPLSSHIERGSTIYYVPSGIIHEIALESLPLADGSLLGQHYNFIRLSSAREIEKFQTSNIVPKTAALYGGLKYNLSPQTLEEESKMYDKTELSWIYRSEYGKEGFKDLSKSQVEIQKIAQTLSENGYKVKSYSGVKGNAESFIAMSGKSPSILHVATHGFYYTPDEADKYDYLNGYSDAMSLSGLVFSGGNAAWLGKEIPSGVLGGILTARDIANLDFKGTDLVMLSACKTAQGNVTAEGLYGLQRAFKKAGAGTLILTLWKVRDPVAESFATTFYKELMNQEGNKRQAFEKTKDIIREKFKDSFDWACFVMVD